ncbi:hypothetical protein B0H16DRAFT_1465308 [Mycena metata]|uniref:Uncharacterized protein n=1 Tax=Mycena metata TaxID=1033252 RepID=A0AAD7IBI8_9AGAR|nr:hypothetical protein B0H16DRAFT_1465308 [Mycena metata]
MTKRSLSTKPRKKIHRKLSKDDGGYNPRIGKAEKAAQHRRNQAAYRARHPELREKERLRVAERRAATKAARRRRDPPKRATSSASIHIQPEERHDEAPTCLSSTEVLSNSAHSFQFQDYRATDYLILAEAEAMPPPRGISEVPRVGSVRCSPTPDERLACDALTALAHGAGNDMRRAHIQEHDTADPPTRHESTRAVWISPFQDDFIDSVFTELPPGVAPLTAAQTESLRTTGAVGLLTPVQAAQMRVATLNARELTPPSAEEAAHWLYRGRTANWSILDHTRGFEIVRWRTGILKAKRRARWEGEVFYDMPQWTGLDDGRDASVATGDASVAPASDAPASFGIIPEFVVSQEFFVSEFEGHTKRRAARKTMNSFAIHKRRPALSTRLPDRHGNRHLRAEGEVRHGRGRGGGGSVIARLNAPLGDLLGPILGAVVREGGGEPGDLATPGVWNTQDLVVRVVAIAE